MDCREFQKNHVGFVDDVLPVMEMRVMERHRAMCSKCARQDMLVRRSLLLVRNLPPIDVSPDFMARLNARLEDLGPVSRVEPIAPRPQLPSVAAFTALAAGLAAVAYLAVETSNYFAPTDIVRDMRVTASIPAFEPAPSLPSSAFVASVPTGMPVWPAVLMVGQSPMRFASLQFQGADVER